MSDYVYTCRNVLVVTFEDSAEPVKVCVHACVCARVCVRVHKCVHNIYVHAHCVFLCMWVRGHVHFYVNYSIAP